MNFSHVLWNSARKVFGVKNKQPEETPSSTRLSKWYWYQIVFYTLLNRLHHMFKNMSSLARRQNYRNPIRKLIFFLLVLKLTWLITNEHISSSFYTVGNISNSMKSTSTIDSNGKKGTLDWALLLRYAHVKHSLCQTIAIPFVCKTWFFLRISTNEICDPLDNCSLSTIPSWQSPSCFPIFLYFSFVQHSRLPIEFFKLSNFSRGFKSSEVNNVFFFASYFSQKKNRNGKWYLIS